MARKTKEKAEATRESVLLAALDLFSEKGYSRTTFSDIGRRIGMTRGAVYWHFENKPALLAALIEYAHEWRKKLIGMKMTDIHTLDDVRRAFVAVARTISRDTMIRKFEFFIHYQMEWSEELLTKTHKKLNEIREGPLDVVRACFTLPEIENRLRADVDVNALTLTLVSFLLGLCKIYLGSCPCSDFGHHEGNGFTLPGSINLEEMVGKGFDFIMGSVLK